MDGWIKIYRKFLDWEWFHVPEMVQLFIYLLLSANREDKKWNGITIQRGQLVTSLESIHQKTSLSVRTIRTCITRLKTTNEIAINSTNRYTQITICNYDTYQYCNSQSDKQNDEPNDKQPTNERQTNDKRTTTNKNIKNKRNNNTSTENYFEDFWNLYDKKVGKDACYKKWAKLSGVDREKIFTTLPAYIASQPDKKYRKNPETYLNQRAWNDEIISLRPAQTTTSNSNNQSYKDSDIWQQR